MKRIDWLAFVAVQLLGLWCGEIIQPLSVRQTGAVLLLPATLVIYLMPASVAAHITDKLIYQVNAVSWVLVVRFARKRTHA
jgi:hypothetical protein